jgi:hypothetical protein
MSPGAYSEPLYAVGWEHMKAEEGPPTRLAVLFASQALAGSTRRLSRSRYSPCSLAGKHRFKPVIPANQRPRSQILPACDKRSTPCPSRKFFLSSPFDFFIHRPHIPPLFPLFPLAARLCTSILLRCATGSALFELLVGLSFIESRAQLPPWSPVPSACKQRFTPRRTTHSTSIATLGVSIYSRPCLPTKRPLEALCCTPGVAFISKNPDSI